MKQQTMADYRPNYPKKILRSAVLTTAAAVALGAAMGCYSVRLDGATQLPDPQIDGEIAIDDTVEPTDELVLDGDVMIDPNADN